MKFLYATAVLCMTLLYLNSSVTVAQQGDLAPFGFKLGISEKDAKNIINSNGKRLMSDQKDSKKIRVMLIQGVIVDLPVDTDGRDVRTELEFYDDKLLSSSVIFVADDAFEQSHLKNEFIEYLNGRFGQFVSEDSMLHFHTWTWHTEDLKLVLHTNSNDNSLKVEYTYKPIGEKRYEAELDQKRGTEKSDPAREMFLDGDYSKPTGYDDKYNYNK